MKLHGELENKSSVPRDLPAAKHDDSCTAYNFCTYFDSNYLARGLAMYRSLMDRSKRPFTLWILCFDSDTHNALSDLDLPSVNLISRQDFEAGDEELVRAQANRSTIEYYWTCTPSLPLWIFREKPEIEVITYLDADLYFFSDPSPAYEELGDGSVLIVEHRYASQHAHLAAQAGIYNVGLMAFRQDEHGLECLRWWRERCLEWCYARMEDGKFGDQKYLDDWPDRFQRVVVLQHKGIGLAPWNLSRYKTVITGDDMTVDGEPLISYHFHGYKPVSRRVIEPATYGYPISVEQVRYLYIPYAFAIDAAENKTEAVTFDGGDTHGSASPLSILWGLLRQHYLLLRPRGLSLMLWHICSPWGRTNQARIAAGFAAHAAGDRSSARRWLWPALRRNPSIVRHPLAIRILIEPWLSSMQKNRVLNQVLRGNRVPADE